MTITSVSSSDFPRVQQVQQNVQKISISCCNDAPRVQKVAGQAFVLLAATFIAGATIAAFQISLLVGAALAGSALLFGVFGIFLINEANNININREGTGIRPVNIPFAGVVNTNNNCWAIALFNMLRNCPAFREELRQPHPELRDISTYLHQIEVDEQSGKAVSGASSNSVRLALRTRHPNTIDRGGSTADAGEVIGLLAHYLPSNSPLLTEMHHERVLGMRRDNLDLLPPSEEQEPGSEVYRRGAEYVIRQTETSVPQIQLGLQGVRYPNFYRLLNMNLNAQPEAEYHVNRRDNSGEQTGYPVIRETHRFGRRPDDLFVRYNRFGYSRQNGHPYKISTPIPTPSQFELDRSFVSSDNHETFELCGFVNHVGTIDQGHYYSVLRGVNPQNGQYAWYKIDDQYVTKLTPEQFQYESENIYIAHFHRRGA